jgi:hypothetical protein
LNALHDKTRRIDVRIRQPKRCDHPIAASFGRPEMDEQNLIFVVFDDAGEFRAAPNKVARSELALEYGVLQMIAVPPHGLEDLAKPLIIADVVTNEIGLPHTLSQQLSDKCSRGASQPIFSSTGF